jgi:putative aldouronate transport system substrate-binding protein
MQKFTDTEILKFISYGPEGEYFDLVDGVYFPKDNAAEIGYQVYYNFWDTVDNFHNRVKYKGFWPYYSAIMGWATYEELYNYAPPLERVENIVTSGRDLFGEYFIKIITGALPLSAWDEYVALRQADGGAERDAAIQDWYDANLKNK